MVTVGMVSLRNNDGIRRDLTPWLGSLVVNPAYRQRNVGNTIKNREFHVHVKRKWCDPTKPAKAINVALGKLETIEYF